MTIGTMTTARDANGDWRPARPPEQRSQVEEEFLSSVSEMKDVDGAYAIPGKFVTVRGGYGGADCKYLEKADF